MAEKTLLVEIEKEQQTRIKQELLERKQESKQEVATEKEVHVFSANAFPKQEVEELQFMSMKKIKIKSHPRVAAQKDTSPRREKGGRS